MVQYIEERLYIIYIGGHMNEKQIKEFAKFCLDNGHRKLYEHEKEIIKSAIDQSSNLNELLQVIIDSLGFDFNR